MPNAFHTNALCIAMETPADRLRRARRHKAIATAAEAARQLGIRVTTYQNYEDGARGFARHALKLARFYKVRPQWLLHGILPMAASGIEEKYEALSLPNQAKALEYIEMLAAKEGGHKP